MEELSAIIESLAISERPVARTRGMDPANLQVLLDTAIERAVQRTRQDFENTIRDLSARVDSLEPPSAAEEYREIQIRPGVQCDETLDIVKSVPEFKGEPQRYVSWRQAAITAHKLFEPYVGSSKYYQAVAILRNKIIGSADAALSAYNTVLNFKAIIARLDFTYMDKKSIFTLEQELSTLRQGQKTIIQFYDEVERKLTAIVNKIIMSHEGDDPLIKSFNQKYRDDALRVFISGLKRPLCDTLFSCKPSDLPTALALAQELETNQNRYHFAAIYNHGLSRALQSPVVQLSPGQGQQRMRQNHFAQRQTQPQPSQGHFGQQNVPVYQNRTQQPYNQSQRHHTANSNFPSHPNLHGFIQNTNQNPPQQSFDAPQISQPIDTDVSMRTVRSNNFQAQKRDITSDRQVPRKIQRINHLGHEVPQDESFAEIYNCQEDRDVLTYQDPSGDLTYADPEFEDEINFLEESRYSPILRE